MSDQRSTDFIIAEYAGYVYECHRAKTGTWGYLIFRGYADDDPLGAGTGFRTSDIARDRAQLEIDELIETEEAEW